MVGCRYIYISSTFSFLKVIANQNNVYCSALSLSRLQNEYFKILHVVPINMGRWQCEKILIRVY